MLVFDYVGLIQWLAEYIEGIRKEKRNEEEQYAAEVVAQSKKLTSSLRALDEMLEDIHEALDNLNIEEPKEDLKKIIALYSKFIRHEMIMPNIVESLSELKRLEDDPKDHSSIYREPLRVIIEKGDRMLELKPHMSDAEAEPFRNEGGFTKFLNHIRNAKTEEDIHLIRRITDELVDTIGRDDLISPAEAQYGALRGEIKKRYRSLPLPPR